MNEKVSALEGADKNRALGFEIQSTSAIAQDSALEEYWPLEALNDGRGVKFKRNKQDVLEVDGILRNSRVLVMVEAKACANPLEVTGGFTTDGKEVKGLRERVDLMKECIADPAVTTEPPEVMALLREFQGKDIIPALSTYNPTLGVVAACRKHTIFCLTHKGPGGTMTL